MTAILREIRQLDSARQRGELDDMEYINAKARLLETVEDVAVEDGPAPAVEHKRATAANPGVWLAVLLFLVGAAVTTLLGTVLLGDLTLALTLTATLSAAVVVAAFKSLDD